MANEKGSAEWLRNDSEEKLISALEFALIPLKCALTRELWAPIWSLVELVRCRANVRLCGKLKREIKLSIKAEPAGN